MVRSILPGLILIGAILAPVPASAEALSLVGPLRVRDVSPLSLFRLDMPPAHGVNAIRRGWGVELSYTHSNLHLVSKAAEQWLIQRRPRQPLRTEDAEDLLEQEGDIFLFDGEVSVLNLTAGYAFSPRWQAMVTIPFHTYGGGFMDSSIENFHENLGMGNDARPWLPQNRIHMVARLGENRQVMLADHGSSGLGDAIFTVRYNREVRPSLFGVVEGALRAPTGREHLYFSKEDPEYGLQTSLQYQPGRTGYYASLSYIWVADEPVFPEVSDTPTLTLAMERRLGEGRWSGIVQGMWSQTQIRGVDQSDLTKARMQVSVGLRHRMEQVTTSFALTENIIHLNNTPDVGVHVGVAWILPTK